MADTVYHQTGRLAQFVLRRDRIRIPIWLFGFLFFTLIVPIAFLGLYGSQEDRDIMANTMENPAMVAMVGPADLTNYTIGVMTGHQMLLLTAVVVGLMNILLVTRHTRGDEESGRIELIRSLPAGRLANLTATVSVYSGINLVLALLIGVGLYLLNIESMDLEGSLLYGAALGGTGIFFTGVTALFAQLSESSRGTIGFSIGVLLIAYLVRGVTDVSIEALSWISPLGWVTKTEVYGANNWIPIVLLLIGSIILFAIANYLNAIRDLEAGFFSAKSGKRYASRFLQTPLGLALRLQRTGIIAWAIGLFVIGVSYGSVLGDLDSFFEGNEMMMQMLDASGGHSFTEQFIPMLMVVMAILATIPPVMAMNKLYGEEKKGRIEHFLARSVSRTKLMASFLIIAVINGFVMVSLAGIGLWVASAAVMEDPFTFGTLFVAAIVYYPAILIMISVSLVLIGLKPNFSSIVWFYLFYSFMVLYFGGLFDMPTWLEKISPFGYIPGLPIDNMEITPIIILTGLAFIMMLIGFIGYRKRDIEV
ncbi:ABC transporter permease [Oceanobacillus halotolerans]|uniref:ABC transporter permease n=1 Tax=Oceanobacillus halotolerans TaxID=2663380 RepID=UPI0013DCF16B|nr:ABC transporter permease [Oceanobacillus halotolerans]